MSAFTGRSMISRLPLGVLGMFVLIFGVESFLARNDLSFRRAWAWDWFISGRNSSKMAAGCDVLCFGDSLIKFNVYPRVLESKANLRSYNLAIGAGPIPSSFFQLRKALEAGAQPKAVVVDFTPMMLWNNVKNWEDLLPYLLDTRDCADLAWTIGDSSFFGRLMLRRALPSMRDRDEIRANIMEAFRGEANGRLAIQSVWRNWSENLGAQVMAPASRPADEKIPWLADLFLPNWDIDQTNKIYARKFLDLTQSRGIKVYWLLPPLDPGIQEKRDREGLDAKFLSFANEMIGAYPNLVVLDASHADYGRDLHIDPIHLDRRGGSVLSADIAHALSQPFPSYRWWVLPKFDGRSGDDKLEDLSQSMVARALPIDVRR